MWNFNSFKLKSHLVCVNLVVLRKLCEKLRCFLWKFTQLARILHDRRSWRSRQISTLSTKVNIWWHLFSCSISILSCLLTWKKSCIVKEFFEIVSLLCCRTGQWQLNRQQVICVRRYCLLWQSEICGNKSQCRIRLCSQVIYLATAFLPAFLSQSNIYRLVRMLWEKVTSYFWRYWECYGMTTAFFAA